MRLSNHWKLCLLLFPIIGTCVLASPGGQRGFFQAWYGVAGLPSGPTDYLHFWNPASLDETDQGPGGNDATSFNFDPDSADGWNMGTDNNKYVLTDGPFTNGVNYTITAWVKPDVTAINAQPYGTIIAERNQTTTYLDFQFYLDPPSVGYGFVIRASGSFSSTANNTNFPNNVWTHVAAVCDADNDFLQVFVNGIGGTQTAMTGTPEDNNVNATAIGTLFYDSPSAANFKFHGSIGKVRFYQRALSQAEIQSEYEADGETGP